MKQGYHLMNSYIKHTFQGSLLKDEMPNLNRTSRVFKMTVYDNIYILWAFKFWIIPGILIHHLHVIKYNLCFSKTKLNVNYLVIITANPLIMLINQI